MGQKQSSQSLPSVATVATSTPGDTPRDGAGDDSIDVEIKPTKVTLDDFDLLKVVGKGSFGKVMQVRHKSSEKIYAMKILRKAALVKRNQVNHTKSERNILQEVQSPFIVRLHYAFQTEDKLYLVLSYLNGGELFFHLKKERKFSESRVRLYAAEIISAVESLHKVDIIYRDLKPENILLDAEGHICITDFGLSKEAISSPNGAKTFCGTPEYLAPEILKGVGHGKAVDWWSLGTLSYEMLTGLPPFYSQNLHLMYEKILKANLTFPPSMSAGAQGLLAALLERDPSKRLGSGPRDASELKDHVFFKNLDWERVTQRDYKPEFIPNVKDETATNNFDAVFTNEAPVDSLVEGNALKSQMHYEGFTYTDENEFGRSPDAEQAGSQANGYLS